MAVHQYAARAHFERMTDESDTLGERTLDAWRVSNRIKEAEA